MVTEQRFPLAIRRQHRPLWGGRLRVTVSTCNGLLRSTIYDLRVWAGRADTSDTTALQAFSQRQQKHQIHEQPQSRHNKCINHNINNRKNRCELRVGTGDGAGAFE